ncbi:PilC/PilY family type IV pilus protein [Methylocaldum gracile]|nr:hypothetical protein [Methylocaldum sp. BRCS4]
MHQSAKAIRLTSLSLGLLASGCLDLSAYAAPLTLSDQPLFLTVPVAPNLVVTLDDSLSMPSAAVPDSIEANQATNRFKSAYFNALYYNPAITYPPPPKYNGTSNDCTLSSAPAAMCYPNISFTAAPINGFDTSRGTVNLATNYWATRQYSPQNTNQTNAGSPNGSSDRGYYGSNTSITYNYGPSTCQVDFDNNSSNDRIHIDSGCSGIFANLASGASLTVTGSSRDGTYTVTSVNSSQQYIYVGNRWSNDLNNQTGVSLSWTLDTTANTYPAYYYLFYTQAGVPRPAACTPTASGQKDDDDCYVKVTVGSASDTFAGTAEQKEQNFANWYSYYRTRNLATVSGAMRAFAGLDGEVRVAWQDLNNLGITCNTFGTNCEGWDGSTTDNRIRRLNATLPNGKTHKQELYDWLARFPVAGSTYLRTAAVRAGDYFTGAININHPLADDPQIRDKPLNPDGTVRGYDACRRNVHLLMTDGGWCGDSVTVGDLNSSGVTLPEPMPTSGGGTTSSWTPGPPYRDYQSNNLADIAFKYWVTDLQSGLDNNVPASFKDLSGDAAAQWLNPKNDPATWQHLNTFIIGLGLGTTMSGTPVSGTGTYPIWGGSTFAGDYSKLAEGASCPNPPTSSSSGSPYCWPYTQTSESCPPSDLNQQRKVYDLWHAAISSRGEFFSAENAQDVVDAFNSVVNAVTAANPSFAALAANSTSIQSGAVLFQARFDTRDWHGQLIAYPVQGDGSVGSPYWDAATIPAPGSRNIFTWTGASGQSFSDCTNLSASQKAVLDTDSSGVVDNLCSDRLNWLRGSHSDEQRNGGAFRNRVASIVDIADSDGDGNRSESVNVEWWLGDIIDSDPAFVKAEDYGYSEGTSALAEPERSSYSAFVSGKSSRTPAVYVGANDGMLHAFRADVGSADSGKELFAYVPAGVYDNLSKLTNPAYTHKYFVDGSPQVSDAYLSGDWKTVLVGGLGAGGKSIYALDISDPDGFNASNVLWEYSDATDLGYTFSQPQIARLNNGQWAAIFGNGYNSASDKAFLYVVNLSNGSQIAKIAAGDSTSNGLSTPVLYDANNDKIIDYAYAGDLQGNLWKFDLSALTLANGGNPLFTATNANGEVQPITVQPVIGNHPNGGVLIYFGTGRYLTATDPSNIEVQSFYAIWDKPNEIGTVPRDNDHIQAQTITTETTEFGFGQRETSNNTVDWGSKRGWYLDLVPPSGAAGERVISRALLKHDRIIFVTVIPSSDPCVSGGDSWLMELDAVTGGRTSISNFDFNADNVFDDADKLASGNVSSGIKSTVGIAETPTWLQSETPGVAYKELSGTTGNIMSIKNRGPSDDEGGGSGSIERKYWMQIQ